MKDFLHRLWFCGIRGYHDWTCAADQDRLRETLSAEPITPSNIVRMFRFSARIWCRRCGHFSALNEDKRNTPVPGCQPWTKDPRDHPPALQ